MLFSQENILIKDYTPGKVNSIEGYLNLYQNTITYVARNIDGINEILQYDKTTGEITKVNHENIIDDPIWFVGEADNNKLLIVTLKYGISKIYKAVSKNLDDITLIFNRPKHRLFNIWTNDDAIIVVSSKTSYSNDNTDIFMYDKDNKEYTVLENLKRIGAYYKICRLKEYFLISTIIYTPGGKYYYAYNSKSHRLVDVDSVIIGYSSCGRVYVNESMGDLLHYRCDEDEKLYDASASKFIPTGEENYSLVGNVDDLAYIFLDSTLYSINKTTFEKVKIISSVSNIKAENHHFIMLNDSSQKLRINYYNALTKEMETFPTSFSTEDKYKIISINVINGLVHIILMNESNKNGYILRKSSNSFDVLINLYQISNFNKGISYDNELVYYHNDPDVGEELFALRYPTDKIRNIANNANLNIFPSPASDKIYISSQQMNNIKNIDIYDIQGEKMNCPFSKNSINISNLKSGIYWVHVLYKNGDFKTGKFIKTGILQN